MIVNELKHFWITWAFIFSTIHVPLTSLCATIYMKLFRATWHLSNMHYNNLVTLPKGELNSSIETLNIYIDLTIVWMRVTRQHVINVNTFFPRSTNIVDVILERLEKYATNLEDLVSQRKKQLLHEKHKSDKLLYRLLPR